VVRYVDAKAVLVTFEKPEGQRMLDRAAAAETMKARTRHGAWQQVGVTSRG
jgi:hypothetical protein